MAVWLLCLQKDIYRIEYCFMDWKLTVNVFLLEARYWTVTDASKKTSYFFLSRCCEIVAFGVNKIMQCTSMRRLFCVDCVRNVSIIFVLGRWWYLFLSKHKDKESS
jgi:hypothetical protein